MRHRPATSSRWVTSRADLGDECDLDRRPSYACRSGYTEQGFRAARSRRIRYIEIWWVVSADPGWRAIGGSRQAVRESPSRPLRIVPSCLQCTCNGRIINDRQSCQLGGGGLPYRRCLPEQLWDDSLSACSHQTRVTKAGHGGRDRTRRTIESSRQFSDSTLSIWRDE